MGLRAAWQALWATVKASPPTRGRRGSTVPLSSIQQWVGGAGVWPHQPGAKLNYAREAGQLDLNAVVSICLGWYRDNLPQAIPNVGSEDEDGEFVAQPDHPLQVFLRDRPNPAHSWRQVIGATVGAFKVDGNAYWIKARDGYGLVRGVYWVPNHSIQVRTNADGYVESYLYSPGRLAESGGGQRSYDPSEVIHFRDGIDPWNPVMGQSRLKANLRSIVGLNEAESYTASLMRNMGVPSVVLVPVGDNYNVPIDEPTANRTIDEYQAKTGGENRGRPWMPSIPVKPERVSLSPQEMALDTILDRPETMVVASMNLNSLVLGLPSSSGTRTYSNLGEADRMAWTNGAVPMLSVLAEGIQDGLGPEFDLDDESFVRFDVSKVDALREEADARVNRAVALFQATLYPRGRALTTCGLDPLESPEDDLYYGEPTERQMEAERARMEAEAEANPDAKQGDDDEGDPE